MEVNARDLMMCEGSVVGVLRGSEEEMRRAVLSVERIVHAGAVSPIVGETFDLCEASCAHEEVIAHAKGTAGKIVLKVDDWD